MLRVLHAVDEVTTNYLGQVGIGIVRTYDVAHGFLLAQYLLVALGAPNVLTVVETRYEACGCINKVIYPFLLVSFGHKVQFYSLSLTKLSENSKIPLKPRFWVLAVLCRVTNRTKRLEFEE